MASKKKAKVVAKKNGAGKDAACEDGAASKQTRGVKAKKTAASGNGAGEGQAKRGTVGEARRKPGQGAKRNTTRNPTRNPKRNPKRTAEKHLKVGGLDAAKKNDGSEEGLDPFEVAKRKVKGSVPAIVEAMVELAKQGSCTHAKTLLEMTGARHMFDGDAEAQDGGEPWAKLVLERLDEADCEAERESAQAESQEVAVAE